MALDILNDEEVQRNKAAAVIQKHFRNYQDRKKRRWKPADTISTKLEDYEVFAAGNDPDLFLSKISKVKNNYALVATGGLRAISIVQSLKGENNFLPLIFLIDNSRQAHDFWNLLKVHFKNSQSKSDFFINLKKSSLSQSKTFRHITCEGFYSRRDSEGLDQYKYPPQELKCYLEALMPNEKDFTLCKNIVENRVISLKQSWLDKDTFKFIKKVCDHNEYDVFCYPSNIRELLETDKEKALIDENITLLSPELIIETSGCMETRVPHKVVHGKINSSGINRKAVYDTRGMIYYNHINESPSFNPPSCNIL